MADNVIEIAAPPDRVWQVLATPGVYDDWVLGAKDVRDADAAWPAVGSKLHHTTGVGPLSVDDETVVEVSERPSRLVLLAKLGPVGSFRVQLDLSATPAGTTVTMHEEPVEGAVTHVPGTDAAIEGRNAISLRRLKQLAEETPAAPR